MITYKTLAKALNMTEIRARRLLKSKSLRKTSYREFEYLIFKRDIGPYPEGTAVIFHNDYEPKVVPGYPQISRILVLRVAVPQHFRDQVIVEEKLNGYNVRVVSYAGKLLALTRGGYICPYTTHRIERIFRSKGIEDLEGYVVFGETVGLENPYTRYRYPECEDFCFYVIDVMKDGTYLPIDSKKKFCEDNNLECVRELAKVNKNDVDKIWEIVKVMESEKREGIVLKDPYNRVPPLKYTTSITNIGDIAEGMKYIFDEGRTYLFPRILREVFKSFEEEPNEELLKERIKMLGEAILLEPLNAVKKVNIGEAIAEEFVLKFYSENVIDEFLSYMQKQGILLNIKNMERENDEIIIWFMKPKRTNLELRNIMSSGLSPLD
ncbi:MAG TPA: RNA ligase [Fervidicoccus fontis]|uniref:RNA ligase n=1 Tax=Fervidicoccus fontis TaxID=683846 RepID=A0A7C2YS13_9CREN|nr:RNA ligase [Fervidicoccus fontis]